MVGVSTSQSAAASVEKMCEFRPFQTLITDLFGTDGAPKVPSPADNGVVRLLVQRPKMNERLIVREARFSVEQGMHGSGWKEKDNVGLNDQICVMSVNSIRTITNSEDEDVWAAAGDQMFMDFDLSKENLMVGDRVLVGNADEGVILQVTSKPHNGCGKFSTRFGSDALKTVNCPRGKAQRLRGIYFSVVREGVVHQGDRITKVAAENQII